MISELVTKDRFPALFELAEAGEFGREEDDAGLARLLDGIELLMSTKS